MANNKKQTSKQIASMASDILKDQNASQIQKSLAGSALSQSKSKHQTGAEMEDVASKVLQSSVFVKPGGLVRPFDVLTQLQNTVIWLNAYYKRVSATGLVSD